MKKLLAILMTVMMCVMLLPTVASAETYPTPAGYNDNDYQKLVAFFEHICDSGMPNGETLFPNYDPADPETWVFEDSAGVEWSLVGDSLRVKSIIIPSHNIPETCTGELDVSGFSYLEYLSINEQDVTRINLEGCERLYYLSTNESRFEELDVTECPELMYLYTSYNYYTELDVSQNPKLVELVVIGSIDSIDVTNNPDLELFVYGECVEDVRMDFDSIPTKHIFSTGYGGVCGGVDLYGESYAVAVPEAMDSWFIGWYDGEGDFLSDEEVMNLDNAPETLEARFLNGDDEYYINVDVTSNEYGTVEYTYNSKDYVVTLEMTPNENCGIGSISVNGEVIVTEPENPYAIENIDDYDDDDHVVEIYVEFVRLDGDDDPTDPGDDPADPGDDPGETPADPSDPPKTGAVSLIGAAAVLVATGATAVTLRKKEN